MHKGYAFVQFTSPFDARSACLGEDGRSISGQVIDVNMVSEPKPNHGQQKTNSSSSGNKGMGQKRSHGDASVGEGGDDIGLVNDYFLQYDIKTFRNMNYNRLCNDLG